MVAETYSTLRSMEATAAVEAPSLGVHLEGLEKQIEQNGHLIGRLMEVSEVQLPPLAGEARQSAPDLPQDLSIQLAKRVQRLTARLQEQQASLSALGSFVERLR